MRFRERIIIVCGHYGAGKTNVAVNLAIASAEEGKKTYLADLDIVNPYFRAADASELMKNAGVIPLIPTYANSNVDIPSLPEGFISVLTGNDDATLFIDVGGDDGAVVLGRYSEMIKASGYEMLYVINKYRPLIADPADAVEAMREIERLSCLSCTGIVNNSSLGAETEAEDFLDSMPYADECAAIGGLPVMLNSYFDTIGGAIEASALARGLSAETMLKMRCATKKLF